MTETCTICGDTIEEHVTFVMQFSPTELSRPIEPLPGGEPIENSKTRSITPPGWVGEADLTGRDKAIYVKSDNGVDYYVVCYAIRRPGKNANYGDWTWGCRKAITDPCDDKHLKDIS